MIIVGVFNFILKILLVYFIYINLMFKYILIVLFLIIIGIFCMFILFYMNFVIMIIFLVIFGVFGSVYFGFFLVVFVDFVGLEYFLGVMVINMLM